MEKFMQSRERYFSLGNVIYPDPTARDAFRQSFENRPGRIQDESAFPTRIKTFDQQLAVLEQERRAGKIPRRAFEIERRQLEEQRNHSTAACQTSPQTHLTEEGGK